MKIPFSLLGLAFVAISTAQTYDPANYRALSWTNVGPNRGGRSIACTGVRNRPNEFYFGAAGGGLWKSTDAGQTWKCVSDGFFKTSSVGAVAVSESNPDVVYAGMGEREIRGNIAQGDGVYRSSDGGKTWQHLGLEEVRTVSKIVIDPKNPDVVYVAALGNVFRDTRDRGVYKSTDGGKTWSKILYESPKAGAVELIMDPSDANTLYAATWDAWRRPEFFNSGGPGSKLWKTTDAGRTWKEIGHNPGLPQGTLGKIGITVAASSPKRVYAIVEAADGGIFRSDDAGATWTKTNESSDWRQRAWYFSHVYADPKNPDRLYVLNVGAGRSNDGGKTFGGLRTTHSDNHDLWIDPDDPSRMIEANDGGASVSTDGGQTWTRENFPTAQFYHVVADNRIPYRIYGAQQDNSSVRLGPYDPDSPTRSNWESSSAGESGFIAVKPDDPEISYGGNYGGNINELNTRTGLSREVDPWPDNPMGHAAADLEHRFQWTFPIVFSPNDPNTLYTASQYLLRTRNAGQSWERISPDLTRNQKSKQQSAGGPLTQDNTSVEFYDTIFSVAESPRRKGVIWTGSDDGLIYVTQDAGRNWQNVTPHGMPTWGRVSMVEASPHDPATAYAAVNDYQHDDVTPYLYRTHDYGKTWTRIVSGIPDGSFLRVCREDPRRKGLLYAGTETGAFVSFDDGDHWQSLQQNLPVTPVHDLTIKDDDLIAATHGRSFWILKGISRLENLTGTAPAKPVLYTPRDRMRTGFGTRASVDYYLPTAAKKVEFEFLSAKGEVLGRADGDEEAGFHTVNASLAHPGFGTFPGMILWSGYARPIAAPPGTYRVRMTVDGQTQETSLRLTKDPRVPFTEKELTDQYEFSVQVSRRTNDANEAVVRIRDTKDQIDRAIKAANDPAIAAEGERLKEKLTGIEGEIYQYRSHSGEDPLNFPIKLNDRLAGVLSNAQSGQQPPSKQAREVFSRLSRALQVQLDALRGVEAKDVAAFNVTLKSKGVAPVEPKTPPLNTAGGRRGGAEEEEERERGSRDDG